MSDQRLKALALGVLVVLWGFILYRWLAPEPVAPQRAGARSQQGAGPKAVRVPEVGLARLAGEHGSGEPTAGRDLFAYFVPPPLPPTDAELAARRMQQEEAARLAEEQRLRDAKAAAEPRPAALPPPPPPIRFKYEGFVEANGIKYAVLRDDNGVQYIGREGDTVAFRFRVLKIGHESIDMGYVDNPHREQIELTGS